MRLRLVVTAMLPRLNIVNTKYRSIEQGSRKCAKNRTTEREHNNKQQTRKPDTELELTEQPSKEDTWKISMKVLIQITVEVSQKEEEHKVPR